MVSDTENSTVVEAEVVGAGVGAVSFSEDAIGVNSEPPTEELLQKGADPVAFAVPVEDNWVVSTGKGETVKVIFSTTTGEAVELNFVVFVHRIDWLIAAESIDEGAVVRSEPSGGLDPVVVGATEEFDEVVLELLHRTEVLAETVVMFHATVVRGDTEGAVDNGTVTVVFVGMAVDELLHN